MRASKYRINSPTIALFLEDGRQVARAIPTGSIVTVESLDGDTLVEATWNQTKVLMFSQDIRARGERIPSEEKELQNFVRLPTRRHDQY